MGAMPIIYVLDTDIIKEITVKQFSKFTDKVCT